MKKRIFSMFLLLLITTSIFATQRWVVGEVFTETW